MKLDIAAGDRPYEDGTGWTHHDFRELPDIELVCDVRDLRDHVEEGSCTVILARHILEHFSFRDTTTILAEWRSLLAEGGMIQIEVPNLGWQVRALAQETNVNKQLEIVELMFGGQDYPGNFHFTGFTQESLVFHLVAAGFSSTHVQDIGMVLVANAVK